MADLVIGIFVFYHGANLIVRTSLRCFNSDKYVLESDNYCVYLFVINIGCAVLVYFIFNFFDVVLGEIWLFL